MQASLHGADIKQQNRIKTARYIMEHPGTSRQEVAKALGFSMPTVFQNVTELMEWGMVYEAGEYGSTGGRKAKQLRVRKGFCCAVGAEIKRRHVQMVLMDLNREITASEEYSLAYQNTPDYYQSLGALIREFVQKNRVGTDTPCQLAGAGLSIPGIIDQDRGLLQQSHVLGEGGIPLQQFSQYIPYAVCFENDANSAAYAEVRDKRRNVVYLSLNDTVGGSIYLGGSIYQGDHFKSAEIGHLVIVPGGRTCYCGKRGCLDAYCSALALRGGRYRGLAEFFCSLDQEEPQAVRAWGEYLDYLALAVSNLRVLFDCDMILGGNVGGYLQGRMQTFERRMAPLNNLDPDQSYIQLGQYKKECSAIGAARLMIDRYLETVDISCK